MKKHTFIQILTIAIISLFGLNNSVAQVGIETSAPKGVLDLNTTTTGLVYPRVALTATNVAAPIVNPNGTLVEGTVVYNTAQTQAGSYDVNPGLYVWDGTKWVGQYIKEEFAIFKQTPLDFRTTKSTFGNPRASDAQNIPGLTNGTFVPTYSGYYKIKVSTSFGAGAMTQYQTADKLSLATTEGDFLFKISGFGGVNIDPTMGATEDYKRGWIYTHSYGVYNDVQNLDIVYDKNMHYSSIVYTRYLTAGKTYTFNLSVNIYTGDNFATIADGGQGHVGTDIPCTVEFSYVGDEIIAP